MDEKPTYPVKIQVRSISSFPHRPGQVQYLEEHSIATYPHLHRKGCLRVSDHMQ